MGKQYLNGVLYGTGEIIKFSPYIYSLEEREVGVHTNGKPLYEKTYKWTINDLHNSNFQSGNMYGEFWLDHVAYDELWMFDTKIINKGTNWRVKSLSLNTPHESTVAMSRTIIQIYQPNNDGYPFAYFKSTDSGPYADRNSLTFYYTFRYTKTTDTPGSGHYTTKGGEAHHYSTSEQIVGTWIDGKPLYEKTYIFDTVMSLNSNTWVNTSYNGDFIKGIIDCKGYAENMIPNAALLASKSSNNLIQLLNLRTSPINCRGFTLQYTKTTD